MPLRWTLPLCLAACTPADTGWISEVFAQRDDVVIGEIVLPGTHDSASYGCSEALGISPDAGTLLNTLWDLPPPISGPSSREIAVNWSHTQSRTIAEQLADGIRYVDLRVTTREAELVTWHSIYSVPLEEPLDALVAFAVAHPKEIVVVSFGLALTEAQLPAFAEALTAPRADGVSVCDRLILADAPAARVTLADAWESGRSLVWAPEKPLRGLLEDRGCPTGKAPIEGYWSRTNTPEGVDAVLAATVPERDPDAILSNDFIFSLEGTDDVVAQLQFVTTYASLRDATLGLGFSGTFPGDMIRKHPGMNVFAGDFYEETDLIEAAIAENRGLVE